MDQPRGQTLSIQEEMRQIIADMQNSRWYKYCDSRLAGPGGYWLLAALAYIDAFLLFVPMELFVALYAIRRRDISIARMTTFIVFMNLLGYLSVFALGLWGSQFVLGLVENYVGGLPVDQVSVMLSQGIVLFSAISAFFSFPVPLTPFSFTAGVLAAPIVLFGIGVLIGKTGRYVISAYVGRYYGVQFMEKVLKHTGLFYVVLLLLSGIMLWKMF